MHPGFREAVAKHVEDGAVPGGGVRKLAEKENRGISRALPRESGCGASSDPQEKQSRRAWRAEGSQERQSERQVVSSSERFRGAASGVGWAEAAFEEARDVRGITKRLRAMAEEIARGGPASPGLSAKSAEPPGEVSDGLGCPGGALVLAGRAGGTGEGERKVLVWIELDAELLEATPGELAAKLACFEGRAVEAKRESLDPLLSRRDVGGDTNPSRLQASEKGREGRPALRRATHQGAHLGSQERTGRGRSSKREPVLAGDLSHRREAFEAILPVGDDRPIVANA